MISFTAVAAALLWPLLLPRIIAAAGTDGDPVGTENLNYRYIQEEEYETGFVTSLKVLTQPIQSYKSKYQQIDVYQSVAASNDASSSHFGKILLLDDNIQLTEKDAPAYNEMMAHVPMMAHPNPKRVLVIGGGDGYVLAEILKHPSVTHVDHVELDEGVIQISKQHFWWTKDLWNDNRVTLHVTDGAQFVRGIPDNFYDVIVQDSSDPEVVEEDGSTVTVLPSSVLYENQHFKDIYRILSEDGIFAFQAETYNIPSSLKGMRQWRALALKTGFQTVKYATIAIPTYSTGQIGMYLCHKRKQGQDIPDSISDGALQQRFDSLIGRPTVYYHPPLQKR
jgi:spermidine synthase